MTETPTAPTGDRNRAGLLRADYDQLLRTTR